MSPTLRLEYACTPAEIEQAKSLGVRKQLAGGSKWLTTVVLVASFVGVLLGGWFRFRELPEERRAILLAAIVGGSVLFVFFMRRLRKTLPITTRIEVSETELAILNGDTRLVTPWSAFGDCLESAELFVLQDRPRQMLVVIPKRAFPSESWQTWFREQAAKARSLPAAPARNEPSISPSSPPSASVTLTVRPSYLDSLACTLASWRTWGMCLFLGGVLFGCFLLAAINPRPNAVNSPAKVLVMLVPFYLYCATFLIGIFSVLSWQSQRKQASPREIALSEECVVLSGADGVATLPWTNFVHFKETFRGFIIWRGSFWVMLPKRSFASLNDLLWCQDVLERRLTRSRWFVG